MLVAPILHASVAAMWPAGYLAIAGDTHSEAPWMRGFEREPIGTVGAGGERIVPRVKPVETDLEPKLKEAW